MHLRYLHAGAGIGMALILAGTSAGAAPSLPDRSAPTSSNAGVSTVMPSATAPGVDTMPVGSESADDRAAKLVDAMTLAEQIMLLRPIDALNLSKAPGAEKLPERLRRPLPAGALGSGGFIPGIPRLGWPAIQETDGPLGIGNIGGLVRPNDEATAFPSTNSVAATFDLALTRAMGEALGREAHSKGFNVVLAGAINLTRDPRNGRTFEYAGEDPLLSGRIVGASIAGIQSQHVVSATKHYALNDQETGRKVLDARISEAAARESDLLAFEIAIQEGRPGAVMCAYNRVNGEYACESDFLLNKVLKGDWKFPGWVMSDWGAVDSLERAISNGLDQESPQEPSHFAGLQAAVESGQIPRLTVRGMALRVVRSLIAVGALDHPATPGGQIDRDAHAALVQAGAEAGAVLLKNDGLLPLSAKPQRILFVGGHADKWVVAGAGSSQVNPYGGLQRDFELRIPDDLLKPSYIASSPLKSLQALIPELEISYYDGSDPMRAAAAARSADIAIVFVSKVQSESMDTADITLPGNQDALIQAVASANPRTGVVLQTGNPVAMPWLADVRFVLEAWYPGQRGGEAIAALLSGKVSPSGRLPMTFPRSIAQLPRPKLDGFVAPTGEFDQKVPPFSVDYDKEGSDVGYRWFERTNADPLFAFGHGLTYTSFRYSGLEVNGGKELSARFKLTNTGKRTGIETAQLYVAPPGRTHRLAGWARVSLEPGETKTVTISADPRILASWSDGAWRRAAGTYRVSLSNSAKLDGLAASVALEAAE